MSMPSCDIRDYTEQEWDALLEDVSNGTTLKAACNVRGRPYLSLVRKRQRVDSDFAERLRQAQIDQILSMQDDIVHIADDSTHDVVDYVDRNGVVRVIENPSILARAALKINTRKWVIERVANRIMPVEDPGADEANTVHIVGGLPQNETT